jgi:hypothetical protein
MVSIICACSAVVLVIRCIDVLPTCVQNMHQVAILQMQTFDTYYLTWLASNAGLVLIERCRANQRDRSEVSLKVRSRVALEAISAPAHPVHASSAGGLHEFVLRHAIASEAELVARRDARK